VKKWAFALMVGNSTLRTEMTSLLSILIPGAIFIGTPFLIAKLLKIKLFDNTNSYDNGFIDGYILGEYDD
jgi:hypothetical protein